MSDHQHDFERRLNDEIGCSEGCECMNAAVRLAEDMCDRIAELETALRDCMPFVAIQADHWRNINAGSSLHPIHCELLDRIGRLTGQGEISKKIADPVLRKSGA
jgi:hypothetical protein